MWAPADGATPLETVVLDAPSGRLVGLRQRRLLVFRGVPYARRPVGPLRWRLPESLEAWTGARDATRFGPVCLQATAPFDAFLGGALSEQSEDCLYLNIFTPSPDGLKRPVMVWIHGGAFVIGAGSQPIYDGSRLAAHDVVIVTINYRLGIFGFLALADASDGHAPGMGAEGLADQMMALDWVRRNIEAFGGDPGNVTVFGESAGAMCVAALLAAPAAAGLYHKAILQSGAAHIGHDREQAGRVARAVLSALSLSPRDGHHAVNMPASLLLKAQTAILASAHDGKDLQKLGRLPFQPSIDGQLLLERPIDALRRGAARNIPIIAGTTREEWKLFSAADPRLRLMTLAGFEARVAHVGGAATPALLRAYAEGSAFERYNAFMGDRTFVVPTERLFETRAAAAPAFAYRFDWRSRFLRGIFGSCHALDLGFVFGTHGDGIASAFFGKGILAEQLADDMMASWTAFARAGDPSTPATGSWPHRAPDLRPTVVFGDGPSHLGTGAETARAETWNTVPDSKIGA
ncbi:MAG TPA: carboxylesterase family protein [Rhizomicrobium sp.]|jgi:para-nitrobenzyl esterase|nr:carboxylesterase family protein [Rhizomicrobium sp.]